MKNLLHLVGCLHRCKMMHGQTNIKFMQMYIRGYSVALKRATYTEYINIRASVFLARNDTKAKLRTF